MASNSEFQAVGNQVWLQGYGNLVRKENHLWWRTRRWWVQTLIWLVFTSGLLAMFIWVVPSGGVDSPDQAAPPEVKCLMFFIRIVGLALAIGVTILAQDAILSERLSGTMAWVLTKPISRVAFILAKLSSYAIGILMTMVVFQAVAVYLLTFLATGKALSLSLYAGMSGILFLDLLFYLTLTVMLSTISNARGLAIGVPLLIIFGDFIFGAMAPWLVNVLPWNLTTSIGATRPAIALSVALGQPVASWMPVIATAAWCLIFTGVAIWRFQKEEF